MQNHFLEQCRFSKRVVLAHSRIAQATPTCVLNGDKKDCNGLH